MNGFYRALRSLVRDTLSLYFDTLNKIRWSLKAKKKCLNTSKRERRITVSLTSYPERIGLVSKAIITILNQKACKPDTVELWLAKEQFPGGTDELPETLKELTRCGLEICWCEDLRSYKKLIPALKKHPDEIIVTADDDAYYSRRWLEHLYVSYLEDPSNIHCHRATPFYFDGNTFSTIIDGRHYHKGASVLNMQVGCAGVLYPPAAFGPDVLNESLFKRLTPTADDIWFWIMAVRYGKKIQVTKHNQPLPIPVLGALKTSKLTDINDHGDKLFMPQFMAITNEYTDVLKTLTEACEIE
ncbi:MAG: hypothetical protein K5869_01270 [Saccharofermentans sp.]|nr:hypothetical protein [Saccharofermentans sp.]